jgi:hypothetical protein
VFGFQGSWRLWSFSTRRYCFRPGQRWFAPGSLVDAKSRSFRQSFLVGFASRIGHRLKESANVATSDALREHGGQLLPVMADRSRAMDELRNGAFPDSDALELSTSDSRAGPLVRRLPMSLSSTADRSLRTRRQPEPEPEEPGRVLTGEYGGQAWAKVANSPLSHKGLNHHVAATVQATTVLRQGGVRLLPPQPSPGGAFG